MEGPVREGSKANLPSLWNLPILPNFFYIHDGGLGDAGDALLVMLATNSGPNDVINNFNHLDIIFGAPYLQLRPLPTSPQA